MMAWQEMFILVFALGGGGGDLLDFAPSEGYWQMREQRIVDVQTMSAVLNDADVTQADKLMAIRSLGELGKSADPALKPAILAQLSPLATSKEPFVGQYAKRSIAWVKGADPDARAEVTSKHLAADLALLPHTSTIVGQMRLSNGVGPVDLLKLMPDFGDQGPNPKEMIQEMTGGIVEVSQMIGNARIDSATVGVTFFKADDDDGYASIVIRGEYDRAAVQKTIMGLAEGEGSDVSAYTIGDIEVIASQDEWERFVIMMPSNELLILMVGGGGDANALFPIDETADLIENGDAESAFGAKLTKEIAKVDRDKAMAWVAMDIPAVMKQYEMEEVFGPFDTAHAMAITADNGDIKVAWQAEGTNAAEIAEAVAFMNEQLVEGRAEIREEMLRNPEMKKMFEPIVKMMDSLHVQAKGKTMTGGLEMPGGLGSIMSMFMMSMGQVEGGFPEEDFEFEEDIVVEEKVQDAVEAAE